MSLIPFCHIFRNRTVCLNIALRFNLLKTIDNVIIIIIVSISITMFYSRYDDVNDTDLTSQGNTVFVVSKLQGSQVYIISGDFFDFPVT